MRIGVPVARALVSCLLDFAKAKPKRKTEKTLNTQYNLGTTLRLRIGKWKTLGNAPWEAQKQKPLGRQTK